MLTIGKNLGTKQMYFTFHCSGRIIILSPEETMEFEKRMDVFKTQCKLQFEEEQENE